MIDTCYVGDVRDGLRAFIAAGVRAQTCVTSPPYWGLRDYGVAGQLGLEPTPQEYVTNMVEVFRLVRDVLADDGTLWLNIGDSYASNPNGGVHGYKDGRTNRGERTSLSAAHAGLRAKNLVGMPWRLAFALQADGWYLRQDIIWNKPNPMPESIRDRCTKAHEYLFLLAKAERYYYDFEAMKEPVSGGACARGVGLNPKARSVKMPDGWDSGAGRHGSFHRDGREKGETKKAYPGNGVGFGRGFDVVTKPRAKQNESFSAAVNELVDTRNRRSVWTIPTEAFADAHFATFPTALVEPCVLAGSRVGDVVIDPFLGSGTVAQVAQSLGRHWVGCELNPAYVAMQTKRTAQHGLELGAA